MCRPIPGAARELRFTIRNPYSAVELGVAKLSVGTLLPDAGPPYTEISVGYFFAASKFDGNAIVPYRVVLPSAALYGNISTFFRPICWNRVRSLFPSCASTFPFAASTNCDAGG